MCVQENKSIELKRLPGIRTLGLHSATLLALTISPPLLLAETPIVIGPLPIEAVTSWIGPNGGSWDQAANWHTGIVPGQGSNPENIDLLDFDTNTGSTKQFSVNSLMGSGHLTVSRALGLAAASSLGALTQRRTTIFGSGNLTVSGDATLHMAVQIGSGTTFLQGNTTVTGSNLDTLGQDGLRLDNPKKISWT